MRSFNRKSKYDPLTEEVELLDANSQYAHIRRDNGQETTISLRHLAPCPSESFAETTEQAQSPEVSRGQSNSGHGSRAESEEAVEPKGGRQPTPP
jgi:hypothetical protein